MALIAACVLFLIYVGNVVLGAITGSAIFGDIAEMLILFVASICFVAAILRREAETRAGDAPSDPQ